MASLFYAVYILVCGTLSVFSCECVSVFSCNNLSECLDSRFQDVTCYELREGELRTLDSPCLPTWWRHVCRQHSQIFHDSCCADHSSCFRPLGLWDESSCSGNNWFCLDLFAFADFKPGLIFARPVTIVFLCTACECGLALDGGQRNVVQVVLQLICQAAFPGKLRHSEVYHPDIPRDKQAAKAPTAWASAPAGRSIVNVHSTMLLLSILASFSSSHLSKANNFLISKVVSTSLGNVFKDEGNFRQIPGVRRREGLLCSDTDGIHHLCSLCAEQAAFFCDPQSSVLKTCFRA